MSVYTSRSTRRRVAMKRSHCLSLNVSRTFTSRFVIRSQPAVEEGTDLADRAVGLVEQEEVPAAFDHMHSRVGQPCGEQPRIEQRHGRIVRASTMTMPR